MRKIVALFLLGCFSLYQFGYYVVYFSFNNQLEKNWEDIISGENLSGLQEYMMEIPISIPYKGDDSHFSAFNTTFEKGGNHYRVVKQRYVDQALQVIYVSDTEKNILGNTFKQWVNSLINDELPDSGSNGLISKVFDKNFSKPHFACKFQGHKVSMQHTYFIFLAYVEEPLFNFSPPPETT